ncbi:MAG: toll/interleukin-1 receptor domain-containing protein [Bacillota bacterium]
MSKPFRGIFISHSSLDKEIVKLFIDDILMGGLGIKITDIFCTSIEGTKIKSGEEWRTQIKEHILNAKIIFLIITSNYKASEMCLNEMGAAWATNNKILTLFAEPINYDSVGILQETKQLEKLCSETSLDRIKDYLQEEFEIPASSIKSDRWTQKKKEFIFRVTKYIQKNPFPLPLSRDVFDALVQEREETQRAFENTLEEKIILGKLYNDISKEKGPEVVKKIKKKHGIITDYNTFEELICNVKNAFQKFDSVTTTFIFNSFTNNDLVVDWTLYSAEIAKAIARKYMDRDYNILWDETTSMEEVSDQLNKLDAFMRKINDIEEFITEYEDNYDGPFNIHNLDFWEEVLGLKLIYD